MLTNFGATDKSRFVTTLRGEPTRQQARLQRTVWQVVAAPAGAAKQREMTICFPPAFCAFLWRFMRFYDHEGIGEWFMIA
ncbi:MAG TPA: hypothetical protein PKE26_12350 [Kiritimatiellia bacterium]|nr:hypothetical protein [Kiritimatiellia bacterium]